MNENKKIILYDIIGFNDIYSPGAKDKIMFEFNDIIIKFKEYEEDFKNDPEILKDIYQCYNSICDLYTTMTMSVLNNFFYDVYNKSADFVLTNYSQEEISFKLDKYLHEKMLPTQFKNDVYEKIKFLAERLDKRFSFDDIALINLIEASSGSNIIKEEGGLRRYDDKIVRSNNGLYYFKTSSTKQIYTHDGSKILNPKGQERKEKDDIQISSFPLGNDLSSTNKSMQKVISILFENLNLCIETYNSIYCKGKNVVENTAKLSNGTTFNFKYIVNDRNIPHLLGFPKGSELSQTAIDFLNIINNNKNKITLSKYSRAIDVLKVIYNNQKAIIACQGLYEEKGKLYEIINWEKVILKTSSFMRGDFFKTCFCLAKLAPDKYLVDKDEKGGYVSIASTEYNNSISTSRSSDIILNELLNSRRQRRDYIFRGFLSHNENVINSMLTGKAETIHIGKQNELLRTLQRFRELFTDCSSNSCYDMHQTNVTPSQQGLAFDSNPTGKSESFAAIVEEIENERFIREFTPQEQAELGLSISRDLSLIPYISSEALGVLKDVHKYNEDVTSYELDEFESVKSNGNNRNKN